jgi:hypothetical protein
VSPERIREVRRAAGPRARGRIGSGVSSATRTRRTARSARSWLSRSLFEMNRQVALNESWGEFQMEARATFLADQALKLWLGPTAFSGNEGA